MSDPLDPRPQSPSPDDAPPERGELVVGGADASGEHREVIEEPAKVMRIGSMIRQLLEEVRGTPLDEPSRERLREIYDRSIHELSTALSPDLRDELDRIALPFEGGEAPSEAELRVAKAQLVGWLEGLFHGIQATLFAQQMAARQQLEQMRQNQLPPGQGGPPAAERPGTYL
ncbi:MAG TPA: bacterial proteasome activator family protein [Acidimicrobiales bacterium]|nr:bacterial proteasome activator family protein [Acidimicrobiales bacterium]